MSGKTQPDNASGNDIHSSEQEQRHAERWHRRSDRVAGGALGETVHEADQPPPLTDQLMQAIQHEIVPQLLRAYRPADAFQLPQRLLPPVDDDAVQRYLRASLSYDAEAHLRVFSELRAAGYGLETLYLDVLAPTAQRLGRLWDTDDCAFPEVTLALWRIQGLVQSLNDEFCEDAEPAPVRRHILLAPAPGSQHTLGFYMLSQFFRRAGWHVCSENDAAQPAFLARLRADWFDVIAFSQGSNDTLEALARCVAESRQASLNPAVSIMVGGAMQLDDRIRDMLGADACSGDAPEAIRTAERLVRQRERSN